MAEGFRLRLRKGGAPVALLKAADGAGLVLSGEADASPRDFYLEFDASSTVTSLRMRHVQRLRGWHPWEFRLKMSVVDDAISFHGDGERGLPSGHYWIRPRVEDLGIESGRRVFFAVEEGEETELTLEATADPRRVELTKTIDEWDAGLRGVLSLAGSRVDSKRPDTWLQTEGARARRKACLMNLLAVMRSRTGISGPLLDSVGEVFFVEVDRVYARVTADLFRMLAELSEDPKQKFYDEGTPTAPVHRKLLTRAEERFGVSTSGFTLRSFRAEGKPSMQVVVGVPPGVAAEHYAEMDLDLGNPLQDVRGFVVHIGELLDAGRTDHLALRAKLARGAASEFLYYRVKKS